MGKTVTADKFEAAINKALQEYGADVLKNLAETTKKIAKEGAKEVSRNAKSTFKGTGRYQKGWTSTYEEKRYSRQGIIYNKDVPGLPHLLENGHALRGGGRWSGRAHIAPAEEKIVEAYEKAVKQKL